MKEVDRHIASPEEIEFRLKYRIDLFQRWNELPNQLKEEYNTIEELYSKFVGLLRDNYEDLKYYAVMFRNIPLYNCVNDIYSIIFFASHDDEIIGYKRKVDLDKSNIKYKVLKLYLENEALFPKLCQKYIGVNFQRSKHQPVPNRLHFEILKNYHNEKELTFLSVSDLSLEQCNTILSHSRKRRTEYPNLYKEYLGESFKMRRFETDEYSFYGSDKRLNFVRNFYIPLLTRDQNRFLLSRVTKYLVQNGLDKNIILHDIDLLRQTKEQRTALRSQIYSIQRDIEKTRQDNENQIERSKQINSSYIGLKETNLQLIKSQRYMGYFSSDHYTESDLETMISWGFNPKNRKYVTAAEIQKVREDIAKEKEREIKLEAEIEQLEADLSKNRSKSRYDLENLKFSLQRKITTMESNIENIENELNSIQEETEKNLMSSESFLYIFYNQEKVFNNVEISVEKLYNLYWLRNPKKMHATESLATSSSIYDLCYSFRTGALDSRTSDPFRHARNKKTGLIILPFASRILIKEWIESYEEKLEEEQRKIQEKKDAEFRQKQLLAEEAERKRRMKYEFNLNNRSVRDSLLQFSESNHEYRLNGRILDSVTQLIENLFPAFDKLSHARTTAAKKGMTIRQVLDMWEQKGRESRELGTLLHNKIEKYFLGRTVEADDSFALFKQFEDRFNLKPYRTEWSVYDEDSGIAGTIDFVDHTDNLYSIYDWKRSDKVIANGFPVKVSGYDEKGNYPIENLDNTPYWHYALQLSMYKYILEKNYNLKIAHLRLGIFHPSYNKPYVLEMPYLEREIKMIVNLRSDIIF